MCSGCHWVCTNAQIRLRNMVPAPSSVRFFYMKVSAAETESSKCETAMLTTLCVGHCEGNRCKV